MSQKVRIISGADGDRDAVDDHRVAREKPSSPRKVVNNMKLPFIHPGGKRRFAETAMGRELFMFGSPETASMDVAKL